MLADAGQLIGKAAGEAFEDAEINAHAGLLHAEENRRERQVDFLVDALEAGFFDFRFQRGNQRANTGSGGGRVQGAGTRTAGAAFTWTGSGTGGSTPNNWWNPADWTESGVSYLAPISGDTAAISLTNNPIVDVGTTCTTNCGSGTLTGIASFTNLPTPAVKSITLSNAGALMINGGTSGAPLTIDSGGSAIGVGGASAEMLTGSGYVSRAGNTVVSLGTGGARAAHCTWRAT